MDQQNNHEFSKYEGKYDISKLDFKNNYDMSKLDFKNNQDMSKLLELKNHTDISKYELNDQKNNYDISKIDMKNTTNFDVSNYDLSIKNNMNKY